MSLRTSFGYMASQNGSSTQIKARKANPRLEILEDRYLLTAGLDANYQYVQGLYQSYLGRSASMPELDSWQPTLVNQGTAAVVAGFANSEEAYHHTIVGFYRQFLGRDPQHGEENELLKAMRGGRHADVIASAFLGSPEFYQRAPQIVGSPSATPTDTMLIRAMFTVLLHREPGSDEVNNFVQNILRRNTRAATALFILTSPEYRGQSVQAFYGSDPTRGILDRSVVPQDQEVQGWVQSGFRLDEIQNFFHASVEAFHLSRIDQDVNQQFVNGLYQDMMGRSASSDERTYWEDQLIQVGRSKVSAAIAGSDEAANHMVRSWYVSLLGRQAINGEQQTYVSMLEKGSPPEAVMAVFLAAPEYFSHSSQTVGVSSAATVETFVQALYHDVLNRTPSSAEVQDYVKNQVQTHGRQGAALTMLNSPEFRTNMVREFYNDLMHRNGNVTDAEIQSWVGSRMNLGDIRKAFLASKERFDFVVHQSQPAPVDGPSSSS